MSRLKDRKVAKIYTSAPSLVKRPSFCAAKNNNAVIVTILKLRTFQINVKLFNLYPNFIFAK